MNGDPKDPPNEGVWLAPKAPEGAGLNTNGEGAVDGAADEEAAEGAAAPKPKAGAAAGAGAGAALTGAPKMKG